MGKRAKVLLPYTQYFPYGPTSHMRPAAVIYGKTHPLLNSTTVIHIRDAKTKYGFRLLHTGPVTEEDFALLVCMRLRGSLRTGLLERFTSVRRPTRKNKVSK